MKFVCYVMKDVLTARNFIFILCVPQLLFCCRTRGKLV